MTVKETLEGMVLPFRWVDKQILREYTKLARKLEKKGKNLGKICVGLDAINIAIYPISNLPNNYTPLCNLLMTMPSGISLATSLLYNCHKELYESRGVLNPVYCFYSKLSNLFRLPILGLAASELINGGSNLYHGLSNNDSQSINDGIAQLMRGVAFSSLVSSIYLKANDPKLLDKAPFWKTAYEKAKNFFSPKPAPKPVPIPIRYQGLEECI